MNDASGWLSVERGEAPLIVSIPHAGTELGAYEDRFVSPWLARRDADWCIPSLYDFARGLDATIVETALSRSIIDVNRDPSGASLYPGQATTALCPTTSFDGEALYPAGAAPDEAEIAERRRLYFEPYHAALAAEIARLRVPFARIILYDAHSIRSRIPRLFDGELPVFNLGTNAGASCDPALRRRVVGRSPQAARRSSSTAASRAAGSRGASAALMRASTRCKWSSPAAPTWPSPGASTRPTGRPRSTLRAPLRLARR